VGRPRELRTSRPSPMHQRTSAISVRCPIPRGVLQPTHLLEGRPHQVIPFQASTRIRIQQWGYEGSIPWSTHLHPASHGFPIKSKLRFATETTRTGYGLKRQTRCSTGCTARKRSMHPGCMSCRSHPQLINRGSSETNARSFVLVPIL
jgi:hypothetical protein